ncbi:MAG TPA: thioredoxin domain-containing protein [Pyrinomonadaceae bacterium]|jgi:protein-disulfide isomerase
MRHRNFVCAAVLGLSVLSAAVTAQTPRPKAGPRPTPRATPKPTPAAPAATPAQQRPQQTAPQPGALAVVNGQTVTLADLDPKVREVVEGFDRNLPSLRKDALDARINQLLLDAEAQKRKVTREQLMDAEVNNRVTEPTEAEVKAVYDANKQQIGNADLSAVRPQIVQYLQSQARQKLVTDLIQRMRTATTVAPGADVNTPNLAPATVVATVGGRTITAGDFEERLKPFLYRMRREIFDAEARALDMKINQMLLEAEARKRNQTPDAVFKAEVADKLKEPTDAEITKFYEDNRARIKADLASVRADIAGLLRDQQQNRVESEFVQKLRAGVPVQIFLAQPEPPVQTISVDDDPSRGDKAAPVTVVVFTDYQCPSCAAVHPVVDETLKNYGNRVRLVVRDFPLEMHAQARKAAEAANAANAQGKYFEYIAVLFKNQSALDVDSLKRYATELGLDRAKFDAALDSGQYAAEVSNDIAEGESYGVQATPTIFINGVQLMNLTPEGLRAALDRALAQKTAAR